MRPIIHVDDGSEWRASPQRFLVTLSVPYGLDMQCCSSNAHARRSFDARAPEEHLRIELGQIRVTRVLTSALVRDIDSISRACDKCPRIQFPDVAAKCLCITP